MAEARRHLLRSGAQHRLGGGEGFRDLLAWSRATAPSFPLLARISQYLAESAGLRDVSLETRRNPAVGTSLRYVWDDLFRAVGIHQTPVAHRDEANFPWRAAR